MAKMYMCIFTILFIGVTLALEAYNNVHEVESGKKRVGVYRLESQPGDQASYKQEAQVDNYRRDSKARTFPELFYQTQRDKKVKRFPLKRRAESKEPVMPKDWQIIINEDFQTGGDVPSTWEVEDNDGDGNTWKGGYSVALESYQPPNNGGYYLYCEDNNGESSLDYLRTPYLPCSTFTEVYVHIDWGFHEHESAMAFIRLWSYGYYQGYHSIVGATDDGLGSATLSLPLPRWPTSQDKVRLEISYYTNQIAKEYAFGIDNVRIYMLPRKPYDMYTIEQYRDLLKGPIGERRAVEASVGNPGENAATNSNVHAEITDGSNKAVVFSKDTLIASLAAGDSLRITFGNWTPIKPGDYTFTVYTGFAGDQEPLNDTMRYTFNVDEWAWKPIADMPDSVYMHATVYSPSNDRIYVIGGGKGLDNSLNTCYRYDPVADSWETMTPMTVPRKWLQGAYCKGKIYVVGGFDGSLVYNNNEIYDCAGNTWSAGQPAPSNRYAHGLATWRDSLIYRVGGNDDNYFPTSTVDYYNPASNTWHTATPLPKSLYMGGVTILGDKIYILGGFPGPYKNVIVGTITPSAPGTITWGITDELPIPNGNNATCTMKGKFYILGGYENGNHITEKCWEYDPTGKGGFYSISDYPFAVARDNYLVARPDSTELYCMGGDEHGFWMGTNKCYKLVHGNIPSPTHDVRMTYIQSPSNIADVNIPVIPSARVKNVGTVAETFNVTFSIGDSTGTNVYTNTQAVSNLAPGATSTVNFTSWTPNLWGMKYAVTVYTALSGDEWVYNDTLYKKVFCISAYDKIASKWTQVAPTIDGTIGLKGEWTNATKLDISDFFGYGDGPDPVGSAYLYVMNDSNNIYMAIDYSSDKTRDEFDGVSINVDENNDGTWAIDSSEGFWDFLWAPGDSINYWANPGWIPILTNPPDFQFASDTGTYEMSIPFGPEKYKLTAAPGDTIGFFCLASNASTNARGGWWPQDMPSDSMDSPTAYGKLALAKKGVVGINHKAMHIPLRFELSKIYPNPPTGKTFISYALPKTTPVTLKIYNLSGRQIKNLVDEIQKPGYYTATWDGKTDNGEELASGNYFIQFIAGSFKANKKLVLVR